uniref:Nonsense-mediated mRNA decay factor SMG8 n=1 Tax=Rhipicephalus zambeziensis TaxID=60191 RepID=A0A224YEU9_9ACAR
MAPSSKNTKPAPYGHRFSVSRIEDILPELSTAHKEKVCIVSFIGKTTLKGSCVKASLIDDVLGNNVLEPELGVEDDTGTDDFRIEGFYHRETRVIFLYCIGMFDSACLVQACRRLEGDLHEKSFLEVWNDFHCTVAQAMLYLFHLSHLVVIVHPTSTLDVSYVHLFRTLDNIRVNCQQDVSDALKSCPVSSEWVQNGRPCSPRVLFVFLTCPLEGSTSELLDVRVKTKPSKLSPIKKLEHSLEDQVYRILRKSRVITNISGNSLFAVPANQEFVYVRTTSSVREDMVDFFLQKLKDFCSPDYDDALSEDFLSLSLGGADEASSQEHSFPAFLWQHIEMALSKGFDDNVGRHPVPADFELPTVSTWFKVATKLRDFFLSATSMAGSAMVSSLKASLDIDVRFSEGRCGKVLPLATSAYQEGLPTHYTAEYHERKLARAFQMFSTHARGPAFQRYAQQLKEDCDLVWKSGRQMCEVLSLTGNHCINPVHRTPENADEVSIEECPLLMPHRSQVVLVSTCNCGRQQSTREDPFILKAANYDFYLRVSADCCGVLERINFPAFEPSAADHEQAAADEGEAPHVELEPPRSRSRAKSLSHSESSSRSASPLSESDFSSQSPVSSNDSDSASSDHDDSDKSISLSDARTQQTDDPDDDDAAKAALVPSNTEYLPGMLHSLSPPGLLPSYSSWSLVCLGPSSLYSHNIGIQDQPGFVAGTNFLLPWDVAVKVDKDRWPSLWEGKRAQTWKGKKNGKGDGMQFTVKVFIGVEYECHHGHRFMCSSPERMLRTTSTGLVKDNANKIANSHMPLYFPCLCRSAKPQVAQLMRLHIVTPKAPVHVTLNPRVQPGPSAPVFFPGNKEPVKLSQSAYWVLRLPFVYEGDAGPYLPPRDGVPCEGARLLSGCYGIVEQAPIR